MKDEISRVLKMMEDGTIDSDRAAELIDLLKETEETDAPAEYLNRTLKIRVQSEDQDNVNVNLPLGIVKTFLKAGKGLAMNVPQAEPYIKDVDFNVLLDAIDNENIGQIVNIDSDEATVRIYIE